jgi:uncharacterized membrane protein
MILHRTMTFFFGAFCVLGLARGARSQTFDIEELPVLPGDSDDDFSAAFFINAQGHVAGERGRPREIYFWNGTRSIAIGTGEGFAGLPSGGGRGLNDVGQMIGGDVGIPGLGFFWDGRSQIPLGTLGGSTSSPADLSNMGHVVGVSALDDESFLSQRPFLWTKEDGIQNLGTLASGLNARASRVNDRGHVAGTTLLEDFSNRGFFWSEETGMVDIGPASDVLGMNEHDQIVGRTIDAFPFRVTVTIGPDNEATVVREDLPTPPNSFGNPSLGVAHDINNAGQAVGFTAGCAAVWSPDGELTLNDGPLTAGGGVHINDSGNVVFAGSDFSDEFVFIRGYLWDTLNDVTVPLPTLGERSSVEAINEFDEIGGTILTAAGDRAVVWRPTGPLPPGSEELLALNELINLLLADGQIFEGDARSLQAKLKAADTQLRSDKFQAAVGILEAAENQIVQLIRNGFLGPSTGDQLLDAIEIVMALISD